MELARVDRLLEVLLGGEGDEEGIGPAPNRMKKFFPPETPAPAKDNGEDVWRAVENAYRSEFLRSSGQDVHAWEQAKAQVKADFLRNPAAQAAASQRVRGDKGQTGYSLNQMVPKNEWATKDDLVDFYSRASREQDPARQAAMMKEFGAHQTEFEARLQQFVNTLLD